MTGTLTERVGFERPNRGSPSRRYAASLEVVAGMALVVSTVVAATVVSIGIARADTLGAATPSESSFAIAVLLALIFAGWGGLTAVAVRSRRRRD